MEEYVFQIMALAVLAIFYGAYLVKMAAQAMRGIRTNQVANRRGETHAVEMVMSIATVAVIIVQLASIALDWNWNAESFRIAGFVIGLVGCVFFIAAELGLGDSWRAGVPKEDDTQFVEDGIYGWSRNPAFLGFDLQYIGVCLMFLNALTIAFSIFAIVMLHLQILHEENYLSQRFGRAYLDYQGRVMRYFGRR
ncbi:methyltransferase family protein [Xiamenia xianingshaonis]|uniref:methyltransferase family protein n=1 Tax=Xiamenia xianingshaonis TaxID=2682776 RepID=UPI0021BD5E08|nr:isoprenylcysteine carboxylmethyltransferase family protein [Xiamenia xianingshaonis]